MKCRFCGAAVTCTFVDLGLQPMSNAYVVWGKADKAQSFHSSRAFVCEGYLPIQLFEFKSPKNIFSQRAYLSSMSDSWLDHCRRYAQQMVQRFRLTPSSLVVQVASNDGCLLEFFKQQGIPVLGLEPAANVAAIMANAGLSSIARSFGTELARELAVEGKRADFIVGNHVLARAPELNDFMRGLAALLVSKRVLLRELPHLATLLERTQFDTHCHEHFSYFSIATAERDFKAHGLALFEVEELPTHGCVFRILSRHEAHGTRQITKRVSAVPAAERTQGLHENHAYARFGERVRETKRGLVEFLIARKHEGKRIVADRPPAKSNTLLNHSGIRTDFIDYAADACARGVRWDVSALSIEWPLAERVMSERDWTYPSSIS